MVRSWEQIPLDDLPKRVRTNITDIETQYHGTVSLFDKTYVLFERRFKYKVVLTGNNPYQISVFRQKIKRHSSYA